MMGPMRGLEFRSSSSLPTPIPYAPSFSSRHAQLTLHIPPSTLTTSLHTRSLFCMGRSAARSSAPAAACLPESSLSVNAKQHPRVGGWEQKRVLGPSFLRPSCGHTVQCSHPPFPNTFQLSFCLSLPCCYATLQACSAYVAYPTLHPHNKLAHALAILDGAICCTFFCSSSSLPSKHFLVCKRQTASRTPLSFVRLSRNFLHFFLEKAGSVKAPTGLLDHGRRLFFPLS